VTTTNSFERIGVEMRVQRLAASVLHQFGALEEAIRVHDDLDERRQELAARIEDLATMSELLPRTHALRWSAEDTIAAHERWSHAEDGSDDRRARHVDLVIALAMLRRAIDDEARLAA
jgi:hypothetical protein